MTVSRDHGTTWETPVAVESATAPPTQPDKEAILADSRHPATAFAVWVDYQVTSGVEPSVNRVMFARTSDSGRTWSAPDAIYSGNDEAQQNQLLLTAGGVLLDVFVEGPTLPSAPHPPPLPVKIRLIRSTDQGKTWSPPVDAARFTFTNAVDPGTGGQLRFTGQNISATSAGNAVYVSWFEDHGDFSTIFVARSEDAGLRWRPRRPMVTAGFLLMVTAVQNLILAFHPETFLLTIAAAEASLALGLVVLLFRRRATLNVDEWSEMQG